MKLDPDLTKIAQHAGLYVLLIMVLKYLYVDPVVRLIKKREALTHGRSEKSKELQDKLEGLRDDYRSLISSTRSELEERRLEKLKNFRAELERKTIQVKKENEAKLLKLKNELDIEMKKLRAEVPELSVSIRKEIVSNILEGKVVRV